MSPVKVRRQYVVDPEIIGIIGVMDTFEVSPTLIWHAPLVMFDAAVAFWIVKNIPEAATRVIATDATSLRLLLRDVRKACSLKNRIEKTPGGGLVS